jgi:hypothetical protein
MDPFAALDQAAAELRKQLAGLAARGPEVPATELARTQQALTDLEQAKQKFAPAFALMQKRADREKAPEAKPEMSLAEYTKKHGLPREAINEVLLRLLHRRPEPPPRPLIDRDIWEDWEL